MVKVYVAENVALGNLIRLELVDGIETYRDLCNHGVMELTVDCKYM